MYSFPFLLQICVDSCGPLPTGDKNQVLPTLTKFDTCRSCLENSIIGAIWCVKGGSFWSCDVPLFTFFRFLVHSGVTVPVCVRKQDVALVAKLCEPNTRRYTRWGLFMPVWYHSLKNNCRFIISCRGVADRSEQEPYLQTVPDCEVCLAIRRETQLDLAWCVGCKLLLRLWSSADCALLRFAVNPASVVFATCVHRPRNSSRSPWCTQLGSNAAEYDA